MSPYNLPNIPGHSVLPGVTWHVKTFICNRSELELWWVNTSKPCFQDRRCMSYSTVTMYNARCISFVFRTPQKPADQSLWRDRLKHPLLKFGAAQVLLNFVVLEFFPLKFRSAKAPLTSIYQKYDIIKIACNIVCKVTFSLTKRMMLGIMWLLSTGFLWATRDIQNTGRVSTTCWREFLRPVVTSL